MQLRFGAAVLACSLFTANLACASGQVFVSGTTKYDPTKTWSGYTILAHNAGPDGVISPKLIDMNGNLVHEWDNQGGSGWPNKVLPGGFLLTNIHPQWKEAGQGESTVAILDFASKPVREVSKIFEVKNPTANMHKQPDGSVWIARNHHDMQLEGNPVGYYVPGMEVKRDGKMLILGHSTARNDKIAKDVQLQSDLISIVDNQGQILWQWRSEEHAEEFKNLLGNSEVAAHMKESIKKSPEGLAANGFDWLHVNTASWLGPNKHFDAGDQRFHPENIICDSRTSGHLFIIDYKTGKIVWQLAPGDEKDTLGIFMGPHHTHMIPKGLPGEGNILVFDNGGINWYYRSVGGRYFSRVMEFDPVSLKIVWEYSQTTNGIQKNPWWLFADQFFFSPFISSAQRLPNGNTLIDEGSRGRVFEVTTKGETVWEYVSPYTNFASFPILYRAYRVPYDWVPQLPKPREVAVQPFSHSQLQMPDVEGNYPSVMSKIDKSAKKVEPAMIVVPREALSGGKITPMAPVKQAPAAPAKQAPKADEPVDEPAMKAY